MYSLALQEQTREYFKNMPFAAMKQYGGKFGVGVFRDNKYIIIDRDTHEKYVYKSIDKLIDNDWAID